MEDTLTSLGDQLWDSLPLKEVNRHETVKEGSTKTSLKEIKPLLFCTRHCNGFHTTENCRALKKKLPPRETNTKAEPKVNKPNTGYVNVIRAPALSLGGIELSGLVSDMPVRCQIDPGAVLSCISRTEAERLGASIDPLSEPLALQVASGAALTTEGTTVLSLSLDRIPGVIFAVRCFVVPGDLPVILPGETFLIAEEVKIDYREACLRIVDRRLFLDTRTADFSASPEGQLMKRILSIRPLAAAPLSLNRERALLKQYSEHNPILGTIPGRTMEIKSTHNTLIRRLLYSVPVKVQQPMKEKIDRLLYLNIIAPSSSPYACAAFLIIKRN